jgi:hypothetical protein
MNHPSAKGTKCGPDRRILVIGDEAPRISNRRCTIRSIALSCGCTWPSQSRRGATDGWSPAALTARSTSHRAGLARAGSSRPAALGHCRGTEDAAAHVLGLTAPPRQREMPRRTGDMAFPASRRCRVDGEGTSDGSKTQTVLPSPDTAAMLFWALLASGQINMRKVDGRQTLATKPIDQPIDHAA